MTNIAEVTAPPAAVTATQVKRRLTPSRTALRTVSVLSPVLLLVGWEILSRAGVLDERFFPAPTLIFQALWDEATTGALWEQSRHSLSRLVVGFLIGAVPAVVLGVAMGLSKMVNAALRPIVSALYPVPKSAVLPLFLLFFGLGEDTIWYFVAMGVFFPVVINTFTGVANVSGIYYDVAENFGAKRARVFWTVALPGAMPNIITGLELGAGMGLIMLAIAEMMGGQGNGWGFMVWNSFQLFTIESMYAYLLVFAIVGLLLALIVGFVGRRLTPWITRH
ncbi:NitT/TauT family transport system permease protein [Nocardioides albertanoniae]|uniref:NitT/TauT family transport system permease protein n=1 Tax=Nocardioides albertanoniae TaxID=1175486 RepID=A0A543A2Z9_9ACTN|nr:ABC transporter permease [Nocardioides albertanoniae]TQL66958.1 NitT/TauT family transport system permease protein [Nocardioides albertanoniae]